MFTRILEHVAEGVSNLARGRQLARVIAMSPHRAGSANCAVEGPGGADGEAAQPGRESHLVVRFDDQVNVVALDREVHDTEVRPRCGVYRGLQNAVETDAAQLRR